MLTSGGEGRLLPDEVGTFSGATTSSQLKSVRNVIEPAFVITKPFEPLTLAIATYQAVTGGVQLDSV